MSSDTSSTGLGRWFLKDHVRDQVDWWSTPQSRGVSPPAVQKPVAPGAELIALPGRETWNPVDCSLLAAIDRRESHRRFTGQPLTLAELALLLWSTQGVRRQLHETAVLRTVPSAGCRHPFETYLAVLGVEELAAGIYRYLPLDQTLVLERKISGLTRLLVEATRGQHFAAQAAVTFIWSVIPTRTEWRYAEASAKVIALDAGHLCQNLYLACEMINCGTCAIAAYDQERCDRLVGVDGEEEFVVYLAPVGKVR